jgi:CDP-diacylglycerol--serine O-phosphatidyltransferase
MRFQKAMFVLPNLFTASSIFCGFYALALAAAGEGHPDRFTQAGLAILFAFFFDAFDGRVARLTKTQSEFGMQLDSLADVVSFGAAPALLLYEWALAPLGIWGLLISSVFAICGALRLARFNVLAYRHEGLNKFFVGLPIPFAAITVVSLVLVREPTGAAVPPIPVAAVSMILSYLMVSNIRYRKVARLSRRTATLVFVLIGFSVVGALLVSPAAVFVSAQVAYILVGVAEQGIFLKRRRAERRRLRSLGNAETADEQETEEYV